MAVGCSSCGGRVGYNANTCPHCGEPNPAAAARAAIREREDAEGRGKGLAAFFALLTFGGVAVFLEGMGISGYSSGLRLEVGCFLSLCPDLIITGQREGD